MDCPACGTPNVTVAKYCRRCGQPLPERDEWVLGAMNTERKERNFPEAGSVYLGDVGEAFLEAVEHYDHDRTVSASKNRRTHYSLLIEGGGVLTRFRVDWPYARIELRGPREAVRQLVRRVVARHGEDSFTARDGRWDRFLERTGVSEAENKTSLLELLS